MSILLLPSLENFPTSNHFLFYLAEAESSLAAATEGDEEEDTLSEVPLTSVMSKAEEESEAATEEIEIRTKKHNS